MEITFTKEEKAYIINMLMKQKSDELQLSIFKKINSDKLEFIDNSEVAQPVIVPNNDLRNIISDIEDIASELGYENPLDIIDPLVTYTATDTLECVLTRIASGTVPINNFSLCCLIDDGNSSVNSENLHKQCEDLEERFLNYICENHPQSPYVLIYKLSQTLTFETCDAIEKICNKYNTELTMAIHSYNNNRYIYQKVSISEILRSCSLSLHKLYSGQHRTLNGFTGELISHLNDNGDSD